MTDLQLNKLRYTLKVALKKLATIDNKILINGRSGYIANESQFVDTSTEMKEIDSSLKLLDRLDVSGDKV